TYPTLPPPFARLWDVLGKQPTEKKFHFAGGAFECSSEPPRHRHIFSRCVTYDFPSIGMA
ncbi:hypothetical protein CEXT_511831, partial [Caerostris extrusa]